MIVRDDRTPEQLETHPVLVIGTDSYMSGWDKGGVSYAAWACTLEDERSVIDWVEARTDMKRVRVVFGDYRPRGVGDCHIYVVNAQHPASR